MLTNNLKVENQKLYEKISALEKEIEDFKRGMGRGPGDHLPWEVLVEIAEFVRENYK